MKVLSSLLVFAAVLMFSASVFAQFGGGKINTGKDGASVETGNTKVETGKDGSKVKTEGSEVKAGKDGTSVKGKSKNSKKAKQRSYYPVLSF